MKQIMENQMNNMFGGMKAIREFMIRAQTNTLDGKELVIWNGGQIITPIQSRRIIIVHFPIILNMIPLIYIIAK